MTIIKPKTTIVKINQKKLKNEQTMWMKDDRLNKTILEITLLGERRKERQTKIERSK